MLAPRRPLALASLLFAGALFAACSGGGSEAGDPDGTPPPASPPNDSDGSTTAGDAANSDGRPDDDGSTSDGGPDAAGGFTYKPVPTGCVTDVTAGDHSFTCETLKVDVTIPDMFAKCPVSGCGLIIELHGDTGTGPLIDAHQTLRARGSQRGYIVLAPTGPAIGNIGANFYPGSTWGPSEDARVVAMVQTFATVFKADSKRVHVAGFSRGGYTTWRLACDQSNLFASVAVGGAGNGAAQLRDGTPEATCFEGARAPARPLDLLILMGRTDFGYSKIVAVRDNALTTYGLGPEDKTIVKQGGPLGLTYTHARAKEAGKPVVEWLDHTYETDPAGNNATGKGHCIPGSTVGPNAPQYSVACKPPTLFDWGAEIVTFFDAHPKP